jgi:succinate-acetate transporter protein
MATVSNDVPATEGAIAFSSYGAFYLAFSALYIPWFGVIDAYETAPAHTKNIDPAPAIFFLAWALFSIRNLHFKNIPPCLDYLFWWLVIFHHS